MEGASAPEVVVVCAEVLRRGGAELGFFRRAGALGVVQ
jgi:hypothetical protein